MFSFLKREKNHQEVVENVIGELKKIYRSKLLPLEEHYHFHEFHSPKLEDPDFDAKPMILLVGQYSTGKTTFIRYLLERDFPGIRIGPEPTTDRFIAVMYDDKEGIIPGNALVVDPKRQFRPLSKYGNAFLNRFQCSTVNSPVLQAISIVDTPGILSGEKQRIDRGYDFTGVLEWFAERVDRIILLFDAHKLDISDEFRRSIEALKGHDDKIRIILNKADMIDHQQLMRVYGALMWSLGKVLQTPEVARVFIGSFWDQPLRFDTNRRLFEDEEQDLFRDLQSLPRNAALRKLNDLIKRARLAKVHAFIIAELRKDMPSVFGKDSKKKDLIKNLGQVYDRIQREHTISPGDFPDIKKMQEVLQHQDFSKFHSLKPHLLDIVDNMLAKDIARLMEMIPQEEMTLVSEPVVKDKRVKLRTAFNGEEDSYFNADFWNEEKWQEIAKELDMEEKDCRNAWQALCDQLHDSFEIWKNYSNVFDDEDAGQACSEMEVELSSDASECVDEFFQSIAETVKSYNLPVHKESTLQSEIMCFVLEELEKIRRRREVRLD